MRTKPWPNGLRAGFVLASIAEAEGSGMLFDIAWLLRLQLLENLTTIVAMLTADSNVTTDGDTSRAASSASSACGSGAVS